MKRLLLMVCLVSVIHFVAVAEDPGLPGGDPDVPIDGGIMVLLAAGTVYGLRSLRKRNEQKKEGS